MIYDQATDTVVGNLGWVDHGSLWLFSVTSGTERQIAVEGAAYLGVKAGLHGLFRVAHHQSGDVAASIRRYDNPVQELATLHLFGDSTAIAGDPELWRFVDPAVLVQTGAGPRLFRVDAESGAVTDLDLSWYNDAAYDLGYQGLVDCISLPDAGLVAVSVQRSSELVLLNIDRNQRVGSVMLAGRGGNPALSRQSGTEFAASDYDCLCLVNAKTGVVRASKPLQAGTQTLTRQFIGDYDLRKTTCAVARPFSSDVLLLDLPTFEVRESVRVSGQPLAVCMTSPSTFVTRDWKTGALAAGNFAA